MNLEELESIIRKQMTITDERLYEAVMSIALDVEKATQDEQRERVKSRVKEAAENLWCIRNEVAEEVDGELKRMPYSLYIGPSLTTLEQFVEKLMEEE